MDDDLLRRPLAELAADVRSARLGARELVGASLAAIEARDPQVAAFLVVDAERAMAEAEAIDARVAAGEPVGSLAGIPIGVKDLEDAAGFVTTYGSAMHADDPPATGDSVLVARLKAAGCVVVGKTNTPEFGTKADTSNNVGRPTRNPWNLDRSAGGSSGGTAAALAAGMVPLATGSDGGGSIRIPAAACGLTGFKPSLGRVPSGGPHPPNWLHLSTKGPMTRTIADAVYALDAVVGPDPSDPRSLPMPDTPWLRSMGDVGVPHRVAWSPNLGYGEVDPAVAAACAPAVERLADLGADVVEIPTVFDRDPVGAWFTIIAACNDRVGRGWRGTPAWERLDPAFTMSADVGAKVSGADLAEALDACHLLNLRLVELFHHHALLLCPTTAGRPGVPGGAPGFVDGAEDPNWVRYTYPFNLTRSPAGSVNVGYDPDGLPIGLQVIGPQHADVAVLRLLAVLEEALELRDDRPPIS